MVSRFCVVSFQLMVVQSFYYSYFTVLCLILLLVSQFPYVWSFTTIYVVIPVLVGLRPLGVSIYNLFSFIKILKLSIPTGLPSPVFSFIIMPFIFIGECSSQMIRPVTLILRLLVNLSFAYLVTLTLASKFVESLLVLHVSLTTIFIFCFSVFYFLYEVFMCFLLTHVSHVMLLSLISDMYHVLSVKFFSQ